ncbi:MAG: NGG1p interacting factor NIF3, partial [Pseudohongiellaceae bacterium]
MVKLSFFVPSEHLEAVKMALFAKGAGKIGDYDCCSWETRGIGQFRPLDGSKPFVGQQGELEQLEEFRVEMVCEDTLIREVVQELIRVHP